MDKSAETAKTAAGAVPDGADPPPRPPPEFDLDACCGQGCEPCILEQFAEAQDRYHAELAAWQARRVARSGRR